MSVLTQEEKEALIQNIRRLQADNEVLVRGGQIQKERIENLRAAIASVCNELGSPQYRFSVRVAYAYDILQEVLSEDALRAFNGVSEQKDG